MTCSWVLGSAAYQPKLVLPLVQAAVPFQQIVCELRSTVPPVWTLNVCEVMWLDAVVMVYGELKPDALVVRLAYCALGWRVFQAE
jgi:hypothetical protein